MKDLRGGTALLTGASRGIGVHIARALANEGMNLVLAARSESGLRSVASEVGQLGASALVVPTDVSDDLARRALVAAAVAEFGAIDVLVNNAGIENTVHYHEQSEAEIEQIVQVNLLGTMMLTRLALPAMVVRGRGHVVNVSSLAGKAGTPYEAVYSTTKHGLMGLTRSLRQEYSGAGVSASVICPGFVSEVGMYADSIAATGVVAPRSIGTSRPEKVARAVIKAIKGDKPEIIVNPNAVRVLTTLAEASPTLGEWLMKRMGVADLFRETSERRAEMAAQPDASEERKAAQPAD
jgi:short-subunit dehydrogenase